MSWDTATPLSCSDYIPGLKVAGVWLAIRQQPSSGRLSLNEAHHNWYPAFTFRRPYLEGVPQVRVAIMDFGDQQ